ncbi:MAG: Ig-like domain-containing protein [Bacilli bacterium]|nr:Ig-like domain-containing protein [Bacilli bacterium]
MKKLLAFMLMLTFAIVLVGCGTKEIAPTSVNITGLQTVAVEGTIKLTASVVPQNAPQTVTWTSAKDNIAAVDQEGNVTGVSAGNTVIRATSTVNTAIVGQIRISVTASDEDNIDLGGYTIKIAQAGHALNETDPFNDLYAGADRQAKQQAWTWVEDNYNCQIEVVAYPDDAEWGTPRWNYILNQAASNTADYDFYTVPDAQIGKFVEGNAIIDVSDWYALYGQGYMDEVYAQSGSYKGNLYSITNGESGIYNVIYYNIALFEKLGLPKSPAQIFNEGNWTYTEFKNFCIAAQAALDGLPEAVDKDFYALSGCAAYYWVGMTNAGGVKIADLSTMTFQPLTDTAIAAADTLRQIFDAGAMFGTRALDGGDTTWNEARSLIASGDLWFVNTSNRWKEDLWSPGNADDTKFGYVPFPRPDGTTKDQQKLGLTGTATWVMPIGRDYTGFGTQCTAENIYRALVKTFQLTTEYRLNSPTYDAAQALDDYARKYTEDEPSVAAFKYIAGNAKTIGFYEPLAEPGNAIVNTGYSDFSTAIQKYVNATGAATFAEAVGPLIDQLQESLTKAFS